MSDGKSFHDLAPDPVPTPDQENLIAQLSEEDVRDIDALLLSYISERWSKVAKVVADAMFRAPEGREAIPDIYYARRLYEYVGRQVLEHRGFLGHMRYCEVRFTAGKRWQESEAVR